MITIKLNHNMTAVIDDQDAHLAQYRWTAIHKGSGLWYAVRCQKCANKRKMFYLHRIIMGCTEGDKKLVDHKSGNSLDNRRQNLRLVDTHYNSFNQRKKEGLTSKYKGVSWSKYHSKWSANIKFSGKKIFLGYFLDEKLASETYKCAALHYYGEYRK